MKWFVLMGYGKCEESWVAEDGVEAHFEMRFHPLHWVLDGGLAATGEMGEHSGAFEVPRISIHF